MKPPADQQGIHLCILLLRIHTLLIAAFRTKVLHIIAGNDGYMHQVHNYGQSRQAGTHTDWNDLS